METCVQRAASSEGLDSTIVEFSNSSMLNFITLNSHILRFLRRSSSRDEPTKLARLCFQQVWTSQSKNLAIHKGALIELIMKEVVYRLLIDCLTAISWLAVMEGGPIGISNGCRVTFLWMLSGLIFFGKQFLSTWSSFESCTYLKVATFCLFTRWQPGDRKVLAICGRG